MYLKDSCDRAPSGPPVSVEWQAEADANRPDEHHERSEREAEAPSLVFLHPHQDNESNEPSHRYVDFEPVEETNIAGKFGGVVDVELVIAQCSCACSQCALPDGDKVQAQS